MYISVDLNSSQTFQDSKRYPKPRSIRRSRLRSRDSTRWKTETNTHTHTTKKCPLPQCKRSYSFDDALSTGLHVPPPLETRRPRGKKKAAHTCAASPFHPPQECVLGAQVDNQRPCNWGTENSVASPWQHPAIP